MTRRELMGGLASVLSLILFVVLACVTNGASSIVFVVVCVLILVFEAGALIAGVSR